MNVVRWKAWMLAVGMLLIATTGCAPESAVTLSESEGGLPLAPATKAGAMEPLTDASPELEPGDDRVTAVVGELPDASLEDASGGDQDSGSAADETGTESPATDGPATAVPDVAELAPPLATSSPAAVDLSAPLAAIVASPTWLNVAPFSAEALRGRVVIVEFWTYG